MDEGYDIETDISDDVDITSDGDVSDKDYSEDITEDIFSNADDYDVVKEESDFEEDVVDDSEYNEISDNQKIENEEFDEDVTVFGYDSEEYPQELNDEILEDVIEESTEELHDETLETEEIAEDIEETYETKDTVSDSMESIELENDFEQVNMVEEVSRATQIENLKKIREGLVSLRDVDEDDDPDAKVLSLHM